MRGAGAQPMLFSSGGSGAASVHARSPPSDAGLVFRVLDAQTRLILLPWTLALTAAAGTVGLAARALTAVGFPPPGCAPAADLAAAALTVEAARRREDACRGKLAALQAEVEALARDRRRAAAKLAKARAELVAERAAAAAAGPSGSAGHGGGAAPAPAHASPGGPGGRAAAAHPGGEPHAAHDWECGDDPATADAAAAAAAAALSPRASGAALAALAAAAFWWGTSGPTWPALAHKALCAVGGAWVLVAAVSSCGGGRRRASGTRVGLFAGAWAMVGFVAAHWLVISPGEGWSELR